MTKMLSIVVPVAATKAGIDGWLRDLQSALEGVTAFEIVLVTAGPDTGSTNFSNSAAHVRVVAGGGRGRTVVQGLHAAQGDWLLCMEPGQPPQAVPQLLQALEQQGPDIVVGSRDDGSPPSADAGQGVRRHATRFLARPLAKINDPHAGMYLLPRAVFERARNLTASDEFLLLELLVKCRCAKIVEIPVVAGGTQPHVAGGTYGGLVGYLAHVKGLYDHRFGKWSSFVQFCFVGASGVAVNLGALAVIKTAGVPLEAAYALAIVVAMTSNFLLNRHLTFGLCEKGPFWSQYLRYAASCSVGSVVNWSVTIALASYAGFFEHNHMLAAVIGILAGTLFNFLISFHWVFKAGKPSAGSTNAPAPVKPPPAMLKKTSTGQTPWHV